MTKPTTTVRLLGLCVTVLLLVSAFTVHAHPRAVRPYATKFSTLSQACHGVLEDECPPSSPNRVDCLVSIFPRNDNHECKLWLGWRTLCMVFVDMRLVPKGVCNFTKEESTIELVRQCLRDVDQSELPAACFETPYYKSLTLRSQRVMDDDEDL